MHRAHAFTAVTLALAPAVARADVYFEITPAGQLPDGQVDFVRLLEPGTFDVYVWGSGPDAGLLHVDFAVAAAQPLGWLLIDLGNTDPFGLFTETNDGAFGFTPDAILGIAARAESPVPLPTQPASAILLYQAFWARADDPLAALDVYPVICATDQGPSPTIHTIGVIATPAPSAGAVLAVATGVYAGRRRRAHRP